MKILAAVLLVGHWVSAQPIWNDGVVVLNTNQVLVGKFSVSHDVLLGKEDDQTLVFPSHKVFSFRYFDVQSNINRHFVSLPAYGSVFRTLYFYEVVVWGNTSVVRRKHNFIDHHNKNKEAANYEYYVLLNEEMIPLRKFRMKVYPKLLSISSFPLENLVAQKKWNPNLPDDAIRIIQLSNQNRQEISIAGL